MAAVPTPLETSPETTPLEPFLGTCRVCSGLVLVVELEGGRDVAVEPAELLEWHPCPLCAAILSRGHKPKPACLRCGGTGRIREPLPDFGIALDADGVARIRITVRRQYGEAMHRPHRCGHPSGTRTAIDLA
jgi:hypothetical protein